MLKTKISFSSKFRTLTQCILFLFLYITSFEIHALPLTYGITVCTEAEQFHRLMKQLHANLDDEDMIIVQVDISNTNQEVLRVIEKYIQIIPSSQFHTYYVPFDSDFAAFKNILLASARKLGCKYFFQLDADEYLSDFLIMNIKWFISQHPKADLIRVPRVNYFVGVKNPDMDLDLGRITYPDLQGRIVDLSNRNIKFTNTVHEVIIGYKKNVTLPYENENNHWDIIHMKTPREQVKGNELYKTMILHNDIKKLVKLVQNNQLTIEQVYEAFANKSNPKNPENN